MDNFLYKVASISDFVCPSLYPVFQDFPNIFNNVYVWTLRRPWKCINIIVLLPLIRAQRYVTRRIVFLKDPAAICSVGLQRARAIHLELQNIYACSCSHSQLLKFQHHNKIYMYSPKTYRRLDIVSLYHCVWLVIKDVQCSDKLWLRHTLWEITFGNVKVV